MRLKFPVPKPFTIRPMRPADLDAVMRIDRLSQFTTWRADYYRSELTQNPQAHYFVLCEPAGVIGYAGYWLAGTEAQIHIIALEPGRRGKGLGKLLFLYLLQYARAQDATLVTLEVRAGNTVAHELYHSLGFEVVGQRRGYYRDTGEDALLMDLDLTRPGVAAHLQEQQEALLARLVAAA